jgi:ABC-2 type transport system permease protein
MRPRAPRWLLIAGAEARLLSRSAFTVTMAAVLPTAIGLLIVWAEGDTGRGGWGAATGLLLVTLMTLTAYIAGTTTLAARRQQFVLKRLRLSGASDTAILAGILAPLAALTVLQAVVLFGVIALADGPPPVQPAPLLLALAAGTSVACVLAIGTAAVTAGPELAQLTTGPIALAFVGGAFWAVRMAPTEVPWHMLALPGAAVLQLARADRADLGAVLALVLLVALATPVAVRTFGWDPRR